MSRRRIVPAGVLSLLILLSPGATGLSGWMESGEDLFGGERSGTVFKDDGIGLAPDAHLAACWTRLGDFAPSPRSEVAIAFDTAAGAAVIFGGRYADESSFNDTWIFDSSSGTWAERFPEISPPARYGAAMAYDRAGGKAVLFGGYGTTPLNDTWLYDMATNTWKNVSAQIAPPARTFPSMAYDSTRNDIILFGGVVGDYFNDTWTFNLSTGKWTNRTKATAPLGRRSAGMAYDSFNDKVVLFGGFYNLADTWIYDPKTGDWTRQGPYPYPSGRFGQAMVFDESRRKVVMFGGGSAQDSYNDTWTYDTASVAWTRAGAPSAPSARFGVAGTYDPFQGELLVFGGRGNVQFALNDTWAYNLSLDSWRDRGGPVPRYGAGIASCGAGGTVVLFGGTNLEGTILNDTWMFDRASKAWTRVPSPVSPGPRYSPSMVYDPDDGVIVLAGGMGYGPPKNDPWIFDIESRTWYNPGASSTPPLRYGQSLSYDTVNHLLILFGGGSHDGLFDDTWTYSVAQNLWVNASPKNSPGPRQSGAMAFDESCGLTVLFGGEDEQRYLGDTWTYDAGANTWTHRNYLANLHAPGPRQAHSMAYDAGIGAVILYGGWSAGALGDAWMYTTSNESWLELEPATAPPARYSGSLAFDLSRGDFILFGGVGSKNDVSYAKGDTWELSIAGIVVQSGEYVSVPYDAKGRARFGALSWNCSRPGATGVRFQLRTAGSETELDSQPFTGPDGNASTYYEKSGQAIHQDGTDDRFIQYRAMFSSADGKATPVLRTVNITYNLLPATRILSPAGGETWTGTQNISWNASDPDNDALSFTIYLSNGTGTIPLASDLPQHRTRWEWDTGKHPSGTYRIIVLVKEGAPDIPVEVNVSSGEFEIHHPPSATLGRPGDGEILDRTPVNLSWSGSDPDGDPLIYYVILGDEIFDPANPPPPLAVTDDTFFAANLSRDAVYHWTVVPSDGKVNGTPAPIRSFILRRPAPNHPPSARLLYPEDGAIVNSTTVRLSWNGTDPESDSIMYHLLFSQEAFDAGHRPAPLVTTAESFHILTGLTNGTTYHWAVIPFDGRANGTMAGTRDFTVETDDGETSDGNHPPGIGSHPPARADVGRLLILNLTADDPDGDELTFVLLSDIEGLSLDSTTGQLRWIPASGQRGNHTIRIRVLDGKGGMAERDIAVNVVATRPTVIITRPLDGERLRGAVTVAGTASEGSARVASVWARIDGGAWARTDGGSWHATGSDDWMRIENGSSGANGNDTWARVQNGSWARIGGTVWVRVCGTENWTLELGPARLPEGAHTVDVMAFDGMEFSNSRSVGFTVTKQTARAPSSAVPLPALVVIIVAGSLGACVYYRMRRRR